MVGTLPLGLRARYSADCKSDGLVTSYGTSNSFSTIATYIVNDASVLQSVGTIACVPLIDLDDCLSPLEPNWIYGHLDVFAEL